MVTEQATRFARRPKGDELVGVNALLRSVGPGPRQGGFKQKMHSWHLTCRVQALNTVTAKERKGRRRPLGMDFLVRMHCYGQLGPGHDSAALSRRCTPGI